MLHLPLIFINIHSSFNKIARFLNLVFLGVNNNNKQKYNNAVLDNQAIVGVGAAAQVSQT